MIFSPVVLFTGFAFGFFIGSLIALIYAIMAWFVKTTTR